MISEDTDRKLLGKEGERQGPALTELRVAGAEMASVDRPEAVGSLVAVANRHEDRVERRS